MEIRLERTNVQAPPTITALPGDRSAWPEDAGRAYTRLVRELDAWSREHGWTQASNTWIAEEAVRRGWNDGN